MPLPNLILFQIFPGWIPPLYFTIWLQLGMPHSRKTSPCAILASTEHDPTEEFPLYCSCSHNLTEGAIFLWEDWKTSSFCPP